MSRAAVLGAGTPPRTSSTAASQEAASPDTTVTVRTPTSAIKYGETTL